MKIYFDEHESMPKLYLSKKRGLKIFLAIPFIIFSVVYLAILIEDPHGALQLHGVITLIEIALLPALLIFGFFYFETKHEMKSCLRYITDEHIFCAPVKDVIKILIIRADDPPKVHCYAIYVIYRKRVRNKEKLTVVKTYFHDVYGGKKAYKDFLKAIENLEKDLGVKIPIEFLNWDEFRKWKYYEFTGWKHYI